MTFIAFPSHATCSLRMLAAPSLALGRSLAEQPE